MRRIRWIGIAVLVLAGAVLALRPRSASETGELDGTLADGIGALGGERLDEGDLDGDDLP